MVLWTSKIFFSPQFKFFANKKILKGELLHHHINLLRSRINEKYGNLNKSYQIETLSIYGLNGDFEGSIVNNISFSYGFEFFKNELILDPSLQKFNYRKFQLSTTGKSFNSFSYPSDGSYYNSNAAYFNCV